MAEVPGPEIITDIFTGNKVLFIALGIILLLIIILSWLKYTKEKLNRI